MNTILLALILLVHPDNPPFAYADEAGVWRGSDVELGRRVAERLGEPLTIEPVEFAKIIPRLKEGSADFAISAVSITPSRARDVDFSVPYARTGASFLYRAGEKPPRMSRLAIERVAVEAGTREDIYLCHHGGDPIRFADCEVGFRLLDAKKVDAIFYDDLIAAEWVAQSNGRYVKSPLEMRQDYGIAVRKGRPDVLAAANAVLAEEATP